MKPVAPPSAVPRRAVVVARVSSSGQDENTSLDSQVAACLKDAAECGATVAAIFTEVISGTLYQARPKMQEALTMIESGQASVLITAKMDRAGRDVDALRDIKRRVERAGGELRFANGMNFSNDALGKFIFSQFASVAELEPGLIRERMMAGTRARVLEGVMPIRSLHPMGYRIPTKSDVIKGLYPIEQLGKYQVLAAEAPIVRDLFERYARGESLRALCRHLHDSGVPTRQGGRGWHSETVRAILTNPLYKGRPVFGRRVSRKDESRAAIGLGVYYNEPRPAAEHLTMSAPALVDAALFDQVQERLSTAQALYSGRNDRKYLLSGLLFCPHCDCRMRAMTGSNHQQRKSGIIKNYRYTRYYCEHSKKGADAAAPRCRCKTYPGAPLESAVLRAVEAVAADPVAQAQAQAPDRATDPGRRAALQKQIVALDRKRMATAEAAIEARPRRALYHHLRRPADPDRSAP